MNIEEQDKYFKNIKSVYVFKYLSEEELKKIFEISNFIEYDPDEKIINEGDIKPFFYAVIQGTVNVLVREKDGREVFICAIGEGEIFGEAGIFLNVKRSANIISIEKSVIMRIHRKKLLDFVRTYPSAGIKILMLIIYSLLSKLREANQEIAFERKADINQDDIDDIVEGFMTGDL